jgi:hypothetical protein
VLQKYYFYNGNNFGDRLSDACSLFTLNLKMLMKKMYVLLAGLLMLTACGEKKVNDELNKKLLEEERILVKEQDALTDEHNIFNNEVKGMEETYLETIETPDSLFRFDFEEHKRVMKLHGQSLEGHRRLLDEHRSMVEKHQARQIEDAVFQQEHDSLLSQHRKLMNEHDKVKAEHEELRRRHKVIIDNYPPDKRKKKADHN